MIKLAAIKFNSHWKAQLITFIQKWEDFTNRRCYPLICSNINVTSPWLNIRNTNVGSFCNIFTKNRKEDKCPPIFMNIGCSITHNISEINTCDFRIGKIIDIYLQLQRYKWDSITIFDILNNQRIILYDDLLMQEKIYSIHYWTSVNICKGFYSL